MRVPKPILRGHMVRAGTPADSGVTSAVSWHSCHAPIDTIGYICLLAVTFVFGSITCSLRSTVAPLENLDRSSCAQETPCCYGKRGPTVVSCYLQFVGSVLYIDTLGSFFRIP